MKKLRLLSMLSLIIISLITSDICIAMLPPSTTANDSSSSSSSSSQLEAMADVVSIAVISNKKRTRDEAANADEEQGERSNSKRRKFNTFLEKSKEMCSTCLDYLKRSPNATIFFTTLAANNYVTSRACAIGYIYSPQIALTCWNVTNRYTAPMIYTVCILKSVYDSGILRRMCAKCTQAYESYGQQQEDPEEPDAQQGTNSANPKNDNTKAMVVFSDAILSILSNQDLQKTTDVANEIYEMVIKAGSIKKIDLNDGNHFYRVVYCGIVCPLRPCRSDTEPNPKTGC